MTPMHPSVKIPPIDPRSLTPPEELARRLQILVGQDFSLTGITRTDGSNLRKLVANTLAESSLPLPATENTYRIVPPKKKGVPKILREYIDTYLVTSGMSYNLQVWNRNPASDTVQIEYTAGERLSASDVRFVLVRVDPDNDRIASVFVVTPHYIVERFGKFGKPTVKQQLIITDTARTRILESNPPMLFHEDMPDVAELVTDVYATPSSSIHAPPESGKVFSLELLRSRIQQLVGSLLPAAATKIRGQLLEQSIADLLGYSTSAYSALAGGYPDLANQALEVKVQDSPTVDLGKYSPQFPEPVDTIPGFTTATTRYLLALTDSESGKIAGIVLCPGCRLGQHFSFVADKSYKCQRSIPMTFFTDRVGQAAFNPD